MSGLGQWPVPPAERRRLRFPFHNQQCQRAGSKSGTSVPIQNPPCRPLRGPPGVGSAVSIEPRTPCQRPASDFVQRLCSPVWKAKAFRPGALQDRRRCRPLDARWRLLWNRYPCVNRVFPDLLLNLIGLAAEHKSPRQRRKRGLRKSCPTRKGRAI
jgi:hypothetical protein